MPSQKRPKPLYQRGDFRLYQREGRPNLEIVWYDGARKRERSSSAGTSSPAEGSLALDRLYLQSTGTRLCPTCGQSWHSDDNPRLASVIADYLILGAGKAGAAAAKGRLAHVIAYLVDRPETRCSDVDEDWIGAFRKWLLARPVTNKAGVKLRDRSLGAVEGCVLQLAAAVNAAPNQRARFKATQMKEVARSPGYRADVATLAAMFRYCLEPDAADTTHHYQDGVNEKLREMRIAERANLLRYLRFAVATWARPDAIYDAQARGQWFPEAGVLDLNPPNRKQTRKFRPKVPIARQFAPFLSSGEAYLPVSSVRASWEKMRVKLGLPAGEHGEAGEKLIRRSIATIARKRIGEAQWAQGQMMLGHIKASVSDIYALPDPANLGLALSVTEAIIDEIEALAPGAYNRKVTANGSGLTLINGG